MKRVFFVHQGARSFFETDLRILRSSFEVEALDNFPPSLAKAPSVWRGVRRADLVYLWFLGRHAVAPLLLAKALGKRTLVVAGGWEVTSCPEIGFGLMRPGATAGLVRRLLRLPDALLSVSESNHRELLENASVDPARTRVIPLGFDGALGAAHIPKERMVLTVGDVNRMNLRRKGLEPFVRLARRFPEVPFVLVGRWAADGAANELRRAAPGNVRLAGYLPDPELYRLMARARVYVQLSYHEAFGCSLAEAMLHRCVPVVSRQFALPEVVGEAGHVVELGDEDGAASAVARALDDEEGGARARERIASQYSLEARARALTALVAELAR